jgi:hypothetical protein
MEELASMRRAAGVYMAAGSLGKRVKSAEEALLLMMKARELGFGDVYGLSQLYCVNGVVAMQGQAMLDMIYRSRVVRVEINQDDAGQRASVTLTRLDGLCAPFTSSWDSERVKDAGFQSPLYRNKALAARKMVYLCVAEAARVVCPEVLSGCYAVEEFGVDRLDDLTATVVAQAGKPPEERGEPVGQEAQDHAKAVFALAAEHDKQAAEVAVAQAMHEGNVRRIRDLTEAAYAGLMSKLEQILREYGASIPAAPAPEPEVIEGDFEAQGADPAEAPDIFDGGADAARLPIPQGGE